MKNTKKILIIIQRSNGDVFLSRSLVEQIQKSLRPKSIDLLVNDDTLPTAKLIPHIGQIYTFSYLKKKNTQWTQERDLIKKIFRKYDLSINLTASDRSVIYALLASKSAISAIEKNSKKSWWKKLLLKGTYNFDYSRHILLNNLEPLRCMGIPLSKDQVAPTICKKANKSIKSKLKDLTVDKFLIFHPSAQYHYKIYPKTLRNDLLKLLNQLKLPIIITGAQNLIDLEIKKTLPILDNVFDFIGQTSIEEYLALSNLSLGYVGMDTLNMHIAAVQNKPIFAIFGPTVLKTWAPWSNDLQLSATNNIPLQTYGKITIFQADMKCVACGQAGCNGEGKSLCLDQISPKLIFNEINDWYQNAEF